MYRIQDFPGNAAPSRVRSSRTFADGAYLGNVIEFLRQVRRTKGMTVKMIARRAGIRERVIIGAENGDIIPKAREFKSWSSALGYSWDQVWSECGNKVMLGGVRHHGHQSMAKG